MAPHTHRGLIARVAGEPLVVFYDGDCGVCSWCVRFARTRDRFGLLTFHGGPEGVEIPPGEDRVAFAERARETVIAWAPGSGRVWTRHLAIARTLAALPYGALWSWPLRLPGLGWLFGLCYDAFAARRHRISAALGMGVCGVEDRPQVPASGERPPSEPPTARSARELAEQSG